MARSREKTQQIGFWDAEVKSHDHDAICLWAHANSDSILRLAHPEQFDRVWTDHDFELPSHNDSRSQEIIESAKLFASSTPRPNPRIIRRSLEHVLRSFTGYRNNIERIVGYADLLIESALPRVSPRYKESTERYVDPAFDGCEITWDSERWSPRVLVEAKSVLPSVGELMRQIQLYRTAFNGKFVVVAPDTSYSDILLDQGILFVQYPTDEPNSPLRQKPLGGSD